MLGIRPTCRTRTWKGCHARQICLSPSELYLTATSSHQISTTLGVVRSAVTARHHESSGCSSCRFKSLLQQDSRVQQLHHQPRKKLLLVACPKSKMKEAGSEKMSAAHCGRCCQLRTGKRGKQRHGRVLRKPHWVPRDGVGLDQPKPAHHRLLSGFMQRGPTPTARYLISYRLRPGSAV